MNPRPSMTSQPPPSEQAPGSARPTPHGPPWCRRRGHGAEQHHLRRGAGWRSHRRVRFGHWIRGRLHRRLLFWLGGTLASMVLVALLAGRAFMGGKNPWRNEAASMMRFASSRFALVWHEPAKRRELAQAVARDFRTHLVVRDAGGQPLDVVGACPDPDFVVPVSDHGAQLGSVAVCLRRRGPPPDSASGFLAALLAAGAVLWLSSSWFARRMTRPLGRLVHTAREIGAGNLSSRTHLTPREAGEVGVLAEAIDHMAVRIEHQLQEHKELLAAVSHEVRTPLSRLRLLVELLRSSPGDAAKLDEIEQEVLEIDRLMGELIASSRLEFQQLDPRVMSVRDLVDRALERAGLRDVPVSDSSQGAQARVDPTLIARALANLIDNARRHAGGVERVDVFLAEPDADEGLAGAGSGLEEPSASRVVVRVLDRGPGFGDVEPEQAFDAFHGRRGGGLGLGLALVRRIAEAHGGRAWAENRGPTSAGRGSRGAPLGEPSSAGPSTPTSGAWISESRGDDAAAAKQAAPKQAGASVCLELVRVGSRPG